MPTSKRPPVLLPENRLQMKPDRQFKKTLIKVAQTVEKELEEERQTRGDQSKRIQRILGTVVR